MFVGIDPEGLIGLARILEDACDSIRRIYTATLPLIGRKGVPAGTLDALPATAAQWGEMAAMDLRWRAGVIRAGRENRCNTSWLLRAEFAAAATFPPGDHHDAYLAWLQNRKASHDRADAAAGQIAGWLHQGWLDWDVTNADLHNITKTIDGLSGRELDRVIARLDSRQLQRWIAEMGHSWNGFSAEERRQAFDLLAGKGSGRSLHRIHEAVMAAAGEHELVDLGWAIRTHSPDTVIARFVALALAEDLARPFSTLAPGLAIQGIEGADPAATTGAAVLGHENALPWFIVDSLNADQDPGKLVESLLRTADIASFAMSIETMLGLIATPEGIGRLAGERQLGPGDSRDASSHRLEADLEQHMIATATDLLTHHPDAAFTHLATTADRNGDLTAAFWHRLVARGESEAIAEIVAKLRGGDLIDLKRFSSAGTDPGYDYPYARNLAFAAATLNRGFVATVEDARSDIDAIGRVAGVATTISGLLSGGAAVAEGAIGTGSGWGIDAFAARAGAEMEGQLTALIDTATARLRPADDIDLQPYPGSANAMLAWTTTYIRLLPHA